MENTEKWIILQVRENCELNYPEIRGELLKHFSELDIFIPVYHEQVGSYVCDMTLMEGYVFVKDNNGNRRTIIEEFHPGRMFDPLKFNEKLKTISGKDIEQFKKQIQRKLRKTIDRGTKVLVTQGIFKNLTGEVTDIEGEGTRVMVQFNQRSRQLFASIPITCVEEIQTNG